MYTYGFVMYAQIIWLSFLYVKSSVIAKFTESRVEQAVEVINLSKSYILDKRTKGAGEHQSQSYCEISSQL